MERASNAIRRCAVYTRKSSEEGLVSRALVRGSKVEGQRGWRVPGPELERTVAIAARSILDDKAAILKLPSLLVGKVRNNSSAPSLLSASLVGRSLVTEDYCRLQLRHFPASELTKSGTSAVHADEFVEFLLNTDTDAAVEAICVSFVQSCKSAEQIHRYAHEQIADPRTAQISRIHGGLGLILKMHSSDGKQPGQLRARRPLPVFSCPRSSPTGKSCSRRSATVRGRGWASTTDPRLDGAADD